MYGREGYSADPVYSDRVRKPSYMASHSAPMDSSRPYTSVDSSHPSYTPRPAHGQMPYDYWGQANPSTIANSPVYIAPVQATTYHPGPPFQ